MTVVSWEILVLHAVVTAVLAAALVHLSGRVSVATAGTPAEPAPRFCAGCGASIDGARIFCTACWGRIPSQLRGRLVDAELHLREEVLGCPRSGCGCDAGAGVRGICEARWLELTAEQRHRVVRAEQALRSVVVDATRAAVGAR